MSESPIHDHHGETGSASVSIAIIFPAVALLFLALAQAVMLATAHDVAVGAAEEGLRVARARHGTLARGQAAAENFARHEPVLGSPLVTVSGATVITVTVRGSAVSLLPGLHLSTAGTAVGARERFTTPVQP